VSRNGSSAKSGGQSPELLAATYVLMGLRYDDDVIEALESEVMKMEESIRNQKIVGMAASDEAKKLLIRQGTKKFGKRSKKAEEATRGYY